MAIGDILPLEIRADVDELGFRRIIRVLIFQNIAGVGHDVAQPLIFKRAVEGYATDPTMQISIDAAQQFMDELWRCGLRPSEGTGSAGSLAATQRHLEDMQKIAFHFIK